METKTKPVDISAVEDRVRLCLSLKKKTAVIRLKGRRYAIFGLSHDLMSGEPILMGSHVFHPRGRKEWKFSHTLRAFNLADLAKDEKGSEELANFMANELLLIEN